RRARTACRAPLGCWIRGAWPVREPAPGWAAPAVRVRWVWRQSRRCSRRVSPRSTYVSSAPGRACVRPGEIGHLAAGTGTQDAAAQGPFLLTAVVGSPRAGILCHSCHVGAGSSGLPGVAGSRGDAAAGARDISVPPEPSTSTQSSGIRVVPAARHMARARGDDEDPESARHRAVARPLAGGNPATTARRPKPVSHTTRDAPRSAAFPAASSPVTRVVSDGCPWHPVLATVRHGAVAGDTWQHLRSGRGDGIHGGPVVGRATVLLACAMLVPAGHLAATAPARAQGGETCHTDSRAWRHVVLFDEGTSPSDADRVVRSACGALTEYYDDIAVAIATSADPDFDRVVGTDRAFSAQRARYERAHGSTAEAPSATAEGATDDRTGDFSGEQWDMQLTGARLTPVEPAGLDDVTVGVLDSGLDAGHPDLADAIDPDASAGCLTGVPDRRPSAWSPGPAESSTAATHGTHVAG